MSTQEVYSAPKCSVIQLSFEGNVLIVSSALGFSLHNMDDNTIYSEDF